jgi:hypothetical protein
MVQTIRQAIGTAWVRRIPGKAGMCVGLAALDRRGRGGGGERKRDERGCGVKMHQLSNWVHWSRLHAMWRIGEKPLQHVDASAARHHD